MLLVLGLLGLGKQNLPAKRAARCRDRLRLGRCLEETSACESVGLSKSGSSLCGK